MRNDFVKIQGVHPPNFTWGGGNGLQPPTPPETTLAFNVKRILGWIIIGN